jgi:hypothetical protein
MTRRRAILLGVAFTFLLIYAGFYYGLSRRGYAEADVYHFQGFFYFQPENTDQWRYLNYGCVVVFYPVNVIDRIIGTGRYPGSEPFWCFSDCPKK